MNPLARDIWIYIILAYGLVSITMWIVARFSPIEWRITRPPMCDNYFADRMRRKRAKCDCKHDKDQKIGVHDTDECHANQDADVQIQCDSTRNSSSDDSSSSDGDDDDFHGGNAEDVNCGSGGGGGAGVCGDDEDIGADSKATAAVHEHQPNTVKHKLDKRFWSAKDMVKFLTGDEAKQPTTSDDPQPNDSGDSFDCNEKTMMLAHKDCDHDCCDGERPIEHTRAHCATDDKNHRRTHASDSHINGCGHQLHFNQNIHEHYSFDSYVDMHICDYVDCDGFQETELLCSENDFTLTNSFWFSIGTLMQQGSDLNPKVWTVCSLLPFHIDFIYSCYNIEHISSSETKSLRAGNVR